MNPLRWRRVCGCRPWWFHTSGCLWGFDFPELYDWELEPNEDDGDEG